MKYLQKYQEKSVILNDKNTIVLYLYSIPAGVDKSTYDGEKTVRKQTEFQDMDEAIKALFGTETYFVDIDPQYESKMEEILEMVEPSNWETFRYNHTWVYGVDCEIVRQNWKITNTTVEADEIDMLSQTKKFNL